MTVRQHNFPPHTDGLATPGPAFQALALLRFGLGVAGFALGSASLYRAAIRGNNAFVYVRVLGLGWTLPGGLLPKLPAGGVTK